MTDWLTNAEAIRSRWANQLVIDADVHHLSVAEHLEPYLDSPWRERFAAGGCPPYDAHPAGGRNVGGRVKRNAVPRFDEADPPAGIRGLVADMARLGIDYSLAFPGDMLELGLHPDPQFEAAVALGYARWATERVLSHEPRIRMLLYLPFGDPDASLRIVETFGDRPGVLGGLVTGTRLERIHRPEFFPVYAALQERDLALGIHAGTAWGGEPFRVFDRFIGAHTMHFPLFHSIHIANLVLNGIPERFPDLRMIFFEQGGAVLPMLMARLDRAFDTGRSELPQLRRRPSEYMRDFFFTVQPLEQPERAEQLREILTAIGTDRILYASDYPHWDCDMPNAFDDLGFLSPADKRRILSQNAIAAFHLPPDTLTPHPVKAASLAAGAATQR